MTVDLGEEGLDAITEERYQLLQEKLKRISFAKYPKGEVPTVTSFAILHAKAQTFLDGPVPLSLLFEYLQSCRKSGDSVSATFKLESDVRNFYLELKGKSIKFPEDQESVKFMELQYGGYFMDEDIAKMLSRPPYFSDIEANTSAPIPIYEFPIEVINNIAHYFIFKKVSIITNEFCRIEPFSLNFSMEGVGAIMVVGSANKADIPDWLDAAENFRKRYDSDLRVKLVHYQNPDYVFAELVTMCKNRSRKVHIVELRYTGRAFAQK